MLLAVAALWRGVSAGAGAGTQASAHGRGEAEEKEPAQERAQGDRAHEWGG
ncbi:hypothetical protein [Nonomuraea sp. B5E05]|uniref:hypothetical protein n=1 Tax=Nonomuraea sp. B5E05 TaxID=3153569 RepID=UPI0032607805